MDVHRGDRNPQQRTRRSPDATSQGLPSLAYLAGLTGGIFFAHTLFINLIRSVLDETGLRASLPWEATVAILFVSTVSVTGTFVALVLRTPLRWVLGGPVRSEQRAAYNSPRGQRGRGADVGTLIREVGRWVLGHACQQMADWHSRGNALDISVNVSGRQLDDDAIVEHISEALAVSGLPATSLIIEVTETALMRNADATAKRLHAIKALGVRIAVDDFGTGYSSLAYLQRFPVDCLKIDQSFTNAITASPESKALIGTLVQLGKDLGLTTLAEGVETSGQMAHLRGEHVNEAQGFLLARPLDALTLETELLMPARLTQGVAVSGAGKS